MAPGRSGHLPVMVAGLSSHRNGREPGAPDAVKAQVVVEGPVVTGPGEIAAAVEVAPSRHPYPLPVLVAVAVAVPVLPYRSRSRVPRAPLFGSLR